MKRILALISSLAVFASALGAAAVGLQHEAKARGIVAGLPQADLDPCPRRISTRAPKACARSTSI